MKTCSKCVMDETAEEIEFTKDGCNFCERAKQSLEETKDLDLSSMLGQIKGDKYDCIIGLSGGIDSSTVLHEAVKRGLRPFCFSVDNGWNTRVSDENILKIVEKLKVPFYRETIDLDKFNKLQKAFVMAGLKNIEIPTDHIIMATTYKLAQEYGIKWILSGGNAVGESIMPESWGYQARDVEHIKDVYKTVWNEELEGLPLCSTWLWNDYKHTYGIETVYLLDYLDYNPIEAKKMLIKEYGWEDYGDKHEESEFTKWFQNYYLPKKWGIDKRKAHLSSLIVAGIITRDKALKILEKKPEYPKTLFKHIMNYPKHEHSDFKQEDWYPKIANIIKNGNIR